MIRRGRRWGAKAALALVFSAVLAPQALARADVSTIVVDVQSGRTIAASDPDRLHHPASLAKMMTVYLAFEAVSKGEITLSQRLPVSHRAAKRPPTRLGLRAGDEVALQDLILSLVTQSANDAAVVIAEGLAGSEDAFASRMTRKGRQLGMAQTVFRNASGLPDPDAWTTARDMSRLAQALLHDFRPHYEYFSTQRFTFRGRVYRNHNHLLGRYDGVDGIKTGYTRASGFHLAASAKRGDRRVVAVVMGGRTSTSRDHEMIALLDTAFEAPELPGRREPVLHALADRVERAAVVFSPIARAEAAPRPPGQAQDAPGDWSVQVGAFSGRRQAEEMAEDIMAFDTRLNADNRRIVVSTARGQTLYLVRFGDFTRDGATDVCGVLRGVGRDCYAVADSQ